MWEEMQPIVKDFIMTACTGILAVLSGFLIALAKKGVEWVTEKIQSIKDEKLRKDVESAVAKLESVVLTTVTSLQQTLGDDIKESLEKGDGVFTKDDLIALKDQAVETVKHQLTQSTTELLSTAYEDLDTLIKDLIEAAVREVKMKDKLTASQKACLEDPSRKLLNE